LVRADLSSASLIEANLTDANVSGAHLAYLDLTRAVYAPASPPPDDYVAGLRGLSTVRVSGPDRLTGLTQLRQLLAKAGLPEEYEATFAIERNKTSYLLHGDQEPASRRWRDRIDGAFRLVMFEWPIAYGLSPGRSLLVLIALAGLFAVVYCIVLRGGFGEIFRVSPKDRLVRKHGIVTWADAFDVIRLRPAHLGSCIALAVHVSLLSTFHIGFRELNVGVWITRLQRYDYTLQAVGWVRVVTGLQSLLSVYLIAMWLLSYFGKPFG
jgi:hypothetical protein